MIYDQQNDLLYQTSTDSIRRIRICFKLITIIGPIAFVMLQLSESSSLLAAFLVFVGALGVMLLNGFYSIIGFRIYRNHLVIITPLSEPCFNWERVRVRRYPTPFLRTDVLISGKPWPYMFAFGIWSRKHRDALTLVEQLAIHTQ